MKKLSQTILFYPCLLTLIFITLLAVTVPAGAIYGSDGDWFSQHVALAEQFRQIFYATGRILPDYTLLGGGSSIYDISYYGFLRPDILISFLLPHISMKYIISAYAAAGITAAINLCFFWLKKHTSLPFFAFLGALLFACGGFTYQAHHQIMFVNYLPFLFLALMGIDTLLEQGRISLLTLALFLLYLHSYYFSVSALFVCLLYFLYSCHRSGTAVRDRYFQKLLTHFASSVLLSVGMAAVLLLPTMLDLLSTSKDSGTSPALRDILGINFSMDSLLYSGYSCGLTLLCLYTLLLSLRRTTTRIISLVLLLCLTLNFVPYVLSGFLYIRYKVLIPLVPLLLLLCTQTLEELYLQKIQHCLPLLVCCIIPAFFHSYPSVILWDFLVTAAGLLLCRLTRHRRALWRCCSYILLLLVPFLTSVIVNRQDSYLPAEDTRQELFSPEELANLSLDCNYRFDYLTAPLSTVNLTAASDIGSTNLYSSVTNSTYADFFYNVMRNPIRLRNRVALTSDANPFFSYLMGIRYIQTRPDYLPFGYRVIASNHKTSASEHAVIAENPKVAPIAYTSTQLLAQSEYQTLDFPYNLMALTNHTIVPDYHSNLKGQALSNGIVPLPSNWKNSYSFSFQKESSMTFPLANIPKDKILILSFDIASEEGQEVSIDINGTLNKLSGKNAPYPNRNHRFYYILSDACGLRALNLKFSTGNYTISNIHAYTADPDCIGNSSIIPFSSEKPAKNAVLSGTAQLKQDGYFVTSLPYRIGYQAYVNGKKVTLQNINNGFVGFPLAAGSHKIVISYSPPGKRTGIFISLISLLIFLLTLKKKKEEYIMNCFLKKETLSELLRYGIIGAATTLVNYLIYILLLYLNSNYLLANTIAWLFAVVFSYIANRKIVFHSQKPVLQEVISFASMRFFTLLLENFLLFYLIWQCNLNPLISKLAVSVVTLICNYIICKCRIFVKGEISHE